MFTKMRQFCYPKVTPVKKNQPSLDQMRMQYANDPAMQLHFDRMQTAQDNTNHA